MKPLSERNGGYLLKLKPAISGAALQINQSASMSYSKSLETDWIPCTATPDSEFTSLNKSPPLHHSILSHSNNSQHIQSQLTISSWLPIKINLRYRSKACQSSGALNQQNNQSCLGPFGWVYMVAL